MTLFQAKMLLTGLKFEAKTGMKMTSKVNTYRIAADILGYPKNSRPSKEQLIRELEAAIVETELQEA